MRIPIKAVREFGRRYGLTHVIIYAQDERPKISHVATWGRTIEGCGQAADFGNKLKDVLGWPESLHAEPPRVRRLQEEIKELKQKILFLQDEILVLKMKDSIGKMPPANCVSKEEP